MTVGDYPEYLAVGYLVNQNIIKDHTKIEKVEVVDDINTVVVRSSEETLIDISNERKIKTSGCANGTIFDNIIDQISEVKLDLDAINSWVDPEAYIELRKKEYPTLQESVHAILDGNLESLQEARNKIKAKYPK